MSNELLLLRQELTEKRPNSCLPVSVIDYCIHQKKSLNLEQFLETVETHDPDDEGRGILVLIPYVTALLALAHLQIKEMSFRAPYGNHLSIIENPEKIPIRKQVQPYTIYPHICSVNVPARTHGHAFFASTPQDVQEYVEQDYRVAAHIAVSEKKWWNFS
jgi:hypothetical protein